MISRFLKVLSLGAVLAPMLALGSGPHLVSFGVSAASADVTVYRALQRKNATYAKVADAQFVIDPDGLSTFEAAQLTVTNKQCKLAFIIDGVASQPAQGTTAGVQNYPALKGTYTPQHGGIGHWSIENANAATAASDITTYALTGGHLTVNAAYTGGSQSLCQTPAQAN